MRKDLSRLRQKLLRLEESRSAYVQQILGERRPLRRGSFVTLRRKCGKPNCHCATGTGHLAHYLSVKEGGRTRMIYIPADLERRVADEAQRYRLLRQARAMLAKLARQTLAVIDELEQALESTVTLTKQKSTRNRRKSRRKRG